ncbi:amidohydrolase family protein [Falsiroseomonas sp. HW251]|uniref:amidohydrolase family protein n=1 Tax=Falsiroseomonas sp. HW251 TaxID=3390998 RepID=UPI003D3153F3
MALDVTGPYRYPAPRPAWLALHEEAILDPGQPIIDPHHHLWVQDGVPYLRDEIAADLASGHDVRATVFVEAHYAYRETGPDRLRPVGETESVVAIAEAARAAGVRTAIAAGMVVHADLRLGEKVEEVIEAHLAAAQGSLRGVRQSFARDEHFPDGIVLRPAPPGMLATPEVRAGLGVLARLGLSFDAMLYHAQLPELTAVAQSLPRLRIVLDHLGCPLGIGPYQTQPENIFAAWRHDIEALARCPNVVVKLGGLGMIITGARHHDRPVPPGSAELAARWRPWFATCIEAFGAARCMFESNFPVDKAMFSYAVAWNAFKRIAADASADEKAALFHDTAARTYSLPQLISEENSD